MSKKSRTLEIDEDLEFQRKEWAFQRVGLVALCLFVLAAMLGLTGMGGPLNRGEAGDRTGPVSVEYERFVRSGSVSTMKLHLHGAPGALRFWVSAPYFERARAEAVAPAPELTSVETSRHVYEIRTGSQDVTVTIDVKHTGWGRLEAEVGLVDGPSVRFSQLAMF